MADAAYISGVTVESADIAIHMADSVDLGAIDFQVFGETDGSLDAVAGKRRRSSDAFGVGVQVSPSLGLKLDVGSNLVANTSPPAATTASSSPCGG